MAAPARRALLDLLLAADGPRTAQELAGALGVHHTAVRQHMLVLRDAGLVAAEPLPPAGRGRPRMGYRAVGEPDPYRWLSGVLAEGLDHGLGPVEVGRRIGAREVPSTDPAAALVTVAQRLGFEPSLRRDGPVIDIVLAADKERVQLLAEAETEADPHRIAEIHTRLADIDAHSAPARAASILFGLGFSQEAQQRPSSEFSGGWRMRVALAALLFSEPDILLLDEPTNYLDLEGTLWLEDHLAHYPKTVVVISHDRDLLDTVVDSILHLEQTKLTFYRDRKSTRLNSSHT